MKNHIFFPIIFILSIIMYAGCTPESDILESRQEIVSTDLIPVNAEVLPELLKNEDFRPLIKEMIKLSEFDQVEEQQLSSLISVVNELKLRYNFQYIGEEQMSEILSNEVIKILPLEDQRQEGVGNIACSIACWATYAACLSEGGGGVFCGQALSACLQICDILF